MRRGARVLAHVCWHNIHSPLSKNSAFRSNWYLKKKTVDIAKYLDCSLSQTSCLANHVALPIKEPAS